MSEADDYLRRLLSVYGGADGAHFRSCPADTWDGACDCPRIAGRITDFVKSLRTTATLPPRTGFRSRIGW